MITLLEQAIELIRKDASTTSSSTLSLSDFISLLKSDEWPEAIPQFLICEDNESDKKERAEGILDHIDVSNVAGKKFLDFGCGEGHVVSEASAVATKSVGYDIVLSGQLAWEVESPFLLTVDFNKVIANAPYDFICLYDVLDHAKNPVEVLNQVKSVCSPETKLFVRCHPWIGRHASHLYRQINKAWVHLFFTEEEIESMGYKIDPIFKTYFPMTTQKKWFEESGFKIISADTTKTVVEPFFRRPELVSRIPKEFKEFPEWQMSQLFNDYVIQLA